MGKFQAYHIDFRNIAQGEVRKYEYILDNKFFIDIDGPELQKGKVNVTLTLEHKPSSFVMLFHCAGTVYVTCDRCLEEMDIPIETDNRLIVKLGKAYSEESDEVLVIAEDEGTLNLAWFLYEFVALAIPMKHIHAPGKCNKVMTSKLKKHSAKRRDDDESDGFVVDDEMEPDDEPQETTNIDPRWDALKELV
ncbi:MAG: DUF177 domain-containing protein [Tannerella sp.]|nr:DUF177 domain-containing protein [Tannerella sp.]